MLFSAEYSPLWIIPIMVWTSCGISKDRSTQAISQPLILSRSGRTIQLTAPYIAIYSIVYPSLTTCKSQTPQFSVNANRTLQDTLRILDKTTTQPIRKEKDNQNGEQHRSFQPIPIGSRPLLKSHLPLPKLQQQLHRTTNRRPHNGTHIPKRPAPHSDLPR
jgi:hypothetical protein